MPRPHRSLRRFAAAVFSSFLVCAPNAVRAFHHVFTGTGALEVQLIAAKLALKSGDTCSIVCAAGSERKCVSLMYGQEAGKGYGGDGESEIARGLPEFASDGESIGEALGRADGIVIACEERGMEDAFVDTLLSNAPNVKHLALLSRHGGKLRSTEDSIRRKCEGLDVAVPFSVLRAGNLVGGGPGGDVEKQGGEEWGLSKFFYDTNYELSSAMITMAMDKFTLGARVTPGDPFKGPNFFSKAMAGNSFEPRDGDTGRTAAAQALLAAVRRDGSGVDVSISTEKAEKPPSTEEWDKLLECQ